MSQPTPVNLSPQGTFTGRPDRYLTSQIQHISHRSPRVSYPSYWPYSYWQQSSTQDIWANALARPEAVGYVIINPSSGPGTQISNDWEIQSRLVRNTGATTLGYVSTNYANKGPARAIGSRSSNTILEEIQRYIDWYKVDGVFLDEVSNGWNEEQSQDHLWYQSLSDQITSRFGAGFITIGNPGVATREEYLPLFDTLVTFENTAERYLTTNQDQILPYHYRNQPKSKFWHMIHDVTSLEQAQACLKRATQLKTGHIYLTEDTNDHDAAAGEMWGNPYDALPSPELLSLQLDWATPTSPNPTPLLSLPPQPLTSIIGDSFSSNTYGNNQGQPWWMATFSQTNLTLVQNYSQAGWNLRDMITGLDSIPSQLTRAAADPSQYVIVCSGGNDVSANRTSAQFRTDLLEVHAILSAQNKHVIFIFPHHLFAQYHSQFATQYLALHDTMRSVAHQTNSTFISTFNQLGSPKTGLNAMFDQGDNMHVTPQGHHALGSFIAQTLINNPYLPITHSTPVYTPTPIPSPQAFYSTSQDQSAIATTTNTTLFPSGSVHRLRASSGGYASVATTSTTIPVNSLVRLSFSYHITNYPSSAVILSDPSSGFLVSSVALPSQDQVSLFGGYKLANAQGSTSIVVRTPSTSTGGFGFNFVLQNPAGTAECIVDIGNVRVDVL